MRLSRRQFLILATGAAAAAGATALGLRFAFPGPPPKRVVVVGAGLSGLAAAWYLHQRGVDVRVLETHSWIGGRVKTHTWSSNQYSEIGAEELLNLDSNLWSLIDQLGLEAVEYTPALDAYYVRGQYIPPPDIPEDPAFVAQVEALPIPAEAKQSYWRFVNQDVTRIGDFVEPFTDEKALAYDEPSFSQWLADRGHHEDVDWFTGVNMRSELCARNDEVSAMLGLDTYFYYFYARWFHLKEGNQALPLAMAAPFQDRVLTGAQVTQVVDRGEKVSVRYRHEGEDRDLTGDACIVSVPGPKAKDILPEAPAEVSDALGRVKYGSYILPHLRFSRRFWKLDHGLNTWSINSDRRINYFVEQTYNQPGEEGIMVGYISADDSKDLFSSDDHGRVRGDAKEGIVDLALGELEEIYPGARDDLVDSIVVQWNYALPYFQPGYLHGTLPYLRAPFGRIALCGDYTEGPGMDAAVYSGFRAAESVMGFL